MSASIDGRIQRLLCIEVVCVLRSSEEEYWSLARERDSQMLALRQQIERLQRIESAAIAVARWDWADSGEYRLADIAGLQNAIYGPGDAVDLHEF